MKRIANLECFNKVFIIHHTDDDGKGAAAIVTHELIENPFAEIKYGKYNYSHKFEELGFPNDGYDEKSVFFFVDLSVDDVIFDAMKKAVNAGSLVVHIDHHKSSQDFINNMNDDEKAIYSKAISFVKMGISGCMLTWIFTCMTSEERMTPNTVNFDMTEGRTHVMLPGNREYGIPPAVRYIDDNDVWIHHYPETKYFNMGFMMEPNKSPDNTDLWVSMLYDWGSVKKYLEVGEVLYKYQSNQNKSNMRNAFTYSFEFRGENIECLCLNTPAGNSRIFGSEFEKYPVVVKFSFDGELWRYTLYSHEKFTDIDVSTIAKTFGGGGHKCAAGFVTDSNIFNDSNRIRKYVMDPEASWD